MESWELTEKQWIWCKFSHLPKRLRFHELRRQRSGAEFSHHYITAKLTRQQVVTSLQIGRPSRSLFISSRLFVWLIKFLCNARATKGLLTVWFFVLSLWVLSMLDCRHRSTKFILVAVTLILPESTIASPRLCRWEFTVSCPCRSCTHEIHRCRYAHLALHYRFTTSLQVGIYGSSLLYWSSHPHVFAGGNFPLIAI